MSRHTLVLLALAAMLLVSAQFLIADAYSPTMLTPEDIADEIAIKYGRSMGQPENYRPPLVDPSFKIITYAGTPCRMPALAREGTAPVVRYAWDFDSDGFIDWQSVYDDQPPHTFEYSGDYYATLYAFDIHGEQSRAVVPVDVRLGQGSPEIVINDAEITFWGMDEKRRRQSSALSDPAERYFLLVTDSVRMEHLESIYDRLVDSFGVTDSDIVVACKSTDPAYDDIIDFDQGIDSAYNYLLALMTSNDDLHVMSMGHGLGRHDSTTLLYGGGAPFSGSPSTIFTEDDDPGDPDLYCTEAEFKLAYGYDYGGGTSYRGLGQWIGKFDVNHDYYFRKKLVATFSNYDFFNDTTIHSDTDIFVEVIKQYLVGDTDNDGFLDSCWDCDGDGNDPIERDTIDGGFDYDDDDWGEFVLVSNTNHDSPQDFGPFYFGVAFDDQFDGHMDLDWGGNYLDSLEIDATDSNNDGLLIGIDINSDGDMNDSVAVDEYSCNLGWDDEVAEWLDSLDYRFVTFTLSECFGGGFIDDLSRDSVLIATSTTAGAYGADGICIGMWEELTGGSYTTVQDSTDVNNDRIMSFREAFNALEDTARSDYSERLDDNGDGVGHTFPLPDPDSTDGYLADSINFGRLPYPAPIPSIVSPVDTADLEDDLWPHFEWSVDTTCDSFEIWWDGVSAEYPDGPWGSHKAVCELDTFTIAAADYITSFPSVQAWCVRSYLGLSRSNWSDTGHFQLTVDYSCCNGIRGNVDGDSLDQVDITDLTYLNDFLNLTHSALPCYPEANTDDLLGEVPQQRDYDALVDYLFISLTPPDSCPQ